MLTVSLTKSLTSGSTNCIAQSQSLAAAGNVILNGGSCGVQPWGSFGANGTYWTLDTSRRIVITSAGNDSTITATINGFRAGGVGQPISETLTMSNGGSVVSALDYLNGGNISLSGGTASTITIGTNGTGSTDWMMPNFDMTPFELNILNKVTGTLAFNIETTNDLFLTPPSGVGPGSTTPQPNVTEIVQGASVGIPTDLTSAVRGWRATITSGQGTLAVQATQAGIVNF